MQKTELDARESTDIMKEHRYERWLWYGKFKCSLQIGGSLYSPCPVLSLSYLICILHALHAAGAIRKKGSLQSRFKTSLQ